MFIKFLVLSTHLLNTSPTNCIFSFILNNLVVFLGDEVFILPTIQHLQLHSAISDKNTFAYEFKQLLNRPPDSLTWLRTGADHADEGLFVFGFRNKSNLKQKAIYCLFPLGI